jgi:ABC-type transport system involved in multi-copper enzyme maturation permease subunit
MGNMAPTLLEMWQQLDFLKPILQVLFSINVDEVTVGGLLSFGLVHPIVLIVTWGLIITICTRVTVGEVDRGTADLLLTLPISRLTIFTTTTVVWIAFGVGFSGCALLGMLIGEATVELSEGINYGRMAIVCANLFTLYLAVGGTTLLISSLLSRRGPAIGIVIGILLISFLINLLEALIPAVGKMKFLGFLHYYRPVEIIRDGAWPLSAMGVLMAIGVVTWVAGAVCFTRRDIPAA